MPADVVPGEPVFVLPRAWRRYLHPRRGGSPGPSGGQSAEICADVRAEVRAVSPATLRRSCPDFPLFAEAMGYLAIWRGTDDAQDREPTPRGAGAALLVTGILALGEAWVFRHGVVFAARATAEAGGLVGAAAAGRGWETPGATAVAGCPDRLARVAWAVRTYLARAAQRDYDLARDALAEYRAGTPFQQALTSYLMPTERDWVRADCARARDWPGGSCPALLVLAAGEVGELRQLLGTCHGMPYSPLSVFVTVLDGIGPAAVGVLSDPFYLDMVAMPAEFLAAIPSDEALRILLREHLAMGPERVLALGVLDRYPARVLRVLAERADSSGPAEQLSSGLLALEVLGRPDVVSPARSGLSARGRQRVESVLSTGAVEEIGAVARLLDGRPPPGTRVRRKIISLIAACPPQYSWGHLIDRIAGGEVCPILRQAAERDPDQAIRVLADRLAPDAPAEVRHLLRALALAHPDSAAREVARRQGPTARELRAMAGGAPRSVAEAGRGTLPRALSELVQTGVRPPVWLVTRGLPQVLLRDRAHAVPDRLLAPFCVWLSQWARESSGVPGPAMARTDDILTACALDSVTGFCWELFEQWRLVGYPAEGLWVLSAQALTRDDDTVRKLVPLLLEWPRQGSSSRAYRGLEVLARIGSDLAVTYLRRLAGRSRDEGLRQRAARTIALIAAERGVSEELLAESTVPDFGLDATGGMTLDVGPRSFRVEFDESLAPQILDGGGTARGAVPPPSAGDDPVLAPVARQRFRALREDMGEVALERVRAMELAMVDQRRWERGEFRRLFVDHSLTRQLARRLVWATYASDGDLGTAFRIGEDHGLADVHDESLVLPENARVGIAHPLDLLGRRRTWRLVLADYRLTQPFDQIDRAVFPLGPGEDLAERLRRFVGVQVRGWQMLTLRRGGWRVNPFDLCDRDFPLGGHVALFFRPSDASALGRDDLFESTSVQRSGRLSAVAISEIVRDLSNLRDLAGI